MATFDKEKTTDNTKQKEIAVKASQLKFVLRSRCLTHKLRFITALLCEKENKVLRNQGSTRLHLKDIVISTDNFLRDFDQPPISKNELQVAVNTVLSSSTPDIIDWDSKDPWVSLTLGDAKRIKSYCKSLNLLVAEQRHFGVTIAFDDNFNLFKDDDEK